MQNYSVEKFINATLFFAKRVNQLGITKLNKLLYFSDFEHFKLYGRPILGDEYIKMDQGPVPEKSYSLFNANFCNNLDASLKDAIEVRNRFVINFRINEIVAKRDPDMSVFSKSEIEIMEKMAEEYKKHTARSMSSKSHDESPWKNTQHLDKIDYKLILDDSENSISSKYAEYWEEERERLRSVLN